MCVCYCHIVDTILNNIEGYGMKSIWVKSDKHRRMKIEATNRDMTIVDLFNEMYEGYWKRKEQAEKGVSKSDIFKEEGE